MVDRSAMHLQPDELMQYFDGTLEERRVRGHLGSCVQCRSRLKDLALTRIAMSPPRSALPGEHVPPEILAQYIEDTLSMEQNRAVEVHLGSCRRCLSDLVSLRKAAAGPLDLAPSEAVSAGVKERLPDYRCVTLLGSLYFKRFRDRVNLVYRPAPESDDPDAYTERMAKYRYPFKKTALKSRIEDMVRKAGYETTMDDPGYTEQASSDYQAGNMRQGVMPSGPSGRTVTTDDALILFALEERERKQVLTVELRDRDGVKPLANVKITLTPAAHGAVTITTDPSGRAVFSIPDGPSTLKIYLEKTWELGLRSLL